MNDEPLGTGARVNLDDLAESMVSASDVAGPAVLLVGNLNGLSPAKVQELFKKCYALLAIRNASREAWLAFYEEYLALLEQSKEHAALWEVMKAAFEEAKLRIEKSQTARLPERQPTLQPQSKPESQTQTEPDTDTNDGGPSM